MSDDASVKDNEKTAAPASTPAKKGGGDVVQFNKNIKIYTNQPLKKYDRGPVKAFKAEGRDGVPAELIAFMCDKAIVPRWQMAANYSSIIHPNLANLVATGAAYIPMMQAEHFMFVYEQNWGDLLVPPQETLAYGIKQDLIMEQFLPVMVGIIRDFHDKAFIHGGLRLDNLFNGNGNSLKSVLVGDGLTTPASFLQPALYEPIERAMADNIARGMGTFADDLYALGVILTILLRSNDPLAGMNDKQIIKEKVSKGSYAALTGKDRFTGAILELLRGILHDDKSQRWNIEEVVMWMEGQRLSPKQALKRKKASRVFHMYGERYTRPEFIAYDLPDNPSDAPQYIEDDKLELWISRSLEDKELLERYEQALLTARDSGMNDNYKHRLVSRMSIALHPPAPVRYKGRVIFPEGMGNALAKAFANKEDLNPFADIIDQGLVMFWLNAQNDKTVDYGSISTRFETCRSFLKNRGLGFGLERCLYTFNPGAPCFSPVLENYYVKTPDEMVMAFEALAKNRDGKSLFLDRHSIAFLSVKDSRILDSYLIELNSDQKYKNILGNVLAIANIQKRFDMPPLPNLSDYVVKVMDPVLERFHDRNLRQRLKKECEKIKKSGDLSKLAMILENVEIIEKDQKSFLKNMVQYEKLEREKVLLNRRLESKGDLGTSTGRTAAATISTIIGGIAMVTLALLEFSSAGLF